MFNYSERAEQLIERASKHLNKPCEYMAVLDVVEALLDKMDEDMVRGLEQQVEQTLFLNKVEEWLSMVKEERLEKAGS